jgi:hypothetical protein
MKSSHFVILLLIILFFIALRIAFYNDSNKLNGTQPKDLDLWEVTGLSSALTALNESMTAHLDDTEVPSLVSDKESYSFPSSSKGPGVEIACNSSEWCSIPMPTKSFFRFSPPNDLIRWKKAQAQAASGEHVLLKQVMKHFPQYMDFLDGDIWFRNYHKITDIYYTDKSKELKLLTSKPLPERGDASLFPGHSVLPPRYDFRAAKRAPVVKIGYFAFSSADKSQAFDGPLLGEAFGGREKFFKQWQEVKHDINTPYILMHSSNENWGLFSTIFPNRSVDWGKCCNTKETYFINEILNHNSTLLWLVNQHHNLTHPKLLTLPRGIPTFNANRKQFIWDTMRTLLQEERKSSLVFSASSGWGPRPRILACVKEKFNNEDFFGQSSDTNKIVSNEYYKNLGRARFGLALGGLGLDTFRYCHLVYVLL